MDVVVTLKPHVVKLRSAESIDFRTDKFTAARSSENISQATLSNFNVEDKLPAEIPPPGARYWPRHYCYDPLNWTARLIQVSCYFIYLVSHAVKRRHVFDISVISFYLTKVPW